MKLGCRELFIALHLLIASYAIGKTPEIWIEQMGQRIPSRTPEGKLIRSISFVLNISGGDEQTRYVNPYGALHFALRTKAGRKIYPMLVRTMTIPMRYFDLVMLQPGVAHAAAYTVYWDKGQIRIPDDTGGAFCFDGVQDGLVFIDVTFDTTDRGPGSPFWNGVDDDIRRSQEFQEQYYYKGRTTCGTLKLYLDQKALKMEDSK